MRAIEGVSPGVSEVVPHWQRQRQKRCLQRGGRLAACQRKDGKRKASHSAAALNAAAPGRDTDEEEQKRGDRERGRPT